MKLWIARDEDGGLYLFGIKPEKNETSGFFEMPISGVKGSILDMMEINDVYPSVTWENSPQEVELILCNTNFDSAVEETKEVTEVTSYKEKYPRYRSNSDAPEVVEEEGYEYYYDYYDELPCADFLEERFWKEYIENMESFEWEFVQAVDWGLKDDGYSEIEVVWRKKITVKQDNNGNQN